MTLAIYIIGGVFFMAYAVRLSMVTRFIRGKIDDNYPEYISVYKRLGSAGVMIDLMIFSLKPLNVRWKELLC